MAWSTLVAMVLAIFLIVVLIMYFTGAWKSFIDNTKAYFSSSNVDNVIQGCNIWQGSDSSYNFCCEKQNVKYSLDGKKQELIITCKELENKTFISGRIKSLDCGGISCS